MKALICALLLPALPAQDWTQWGGPNGNFQIEAKGIAASWPTGGPRKLWSRALGDGYSSVLAASGKLYTMYRRGTQDVTVAMDATTGKTLWETASDAPHATGMDMSFGPGPHSTPAIAGNRLFITTTTGQLHALDLASGKKLWSSDLWKELKGTFLDRGYSSSPLIYKDTVIVQVGGRGKALVAFRQDSGKVVWSKGDFENSPSSPILVKFGGRDMVIAFMAKQVVGMDAGSGEVLWNSPHTTMYDINASTPLWGPDGIVFISSAYNGGSRGVQLTTSSAIAARELWHNNRMRIHHGNAVRIGDTVYGSSGDFGPAPFTAIDVKTGKVLWQDRRFSKANMVHVGGGRLIVLDEDGTLALVTVTPQALQVHSEEEILSKNAWTAPTVSGTTLYVRDRKNLMAFDLK